MGLRDFILYEMQRRDISARQFADIVGVSNQTISRAVSDDAPVPSLEFLNKLARATGTDICSLVALVYPESSKQQTSARALLLAQRIEQLSAEQQDTIDALLLGIAQKRTNTST